jgi:hypothetical protein
MGLLEVAAPVLEAGFLLLLLVAATTVIAGIASAAAAARRLTFRSVENLNVTAELSLGKKTSFFFLLPCPYLLLSFSCSTESPTHDAVNEHGIRRGTEQWRRVFAQHGAAATADRHRTSAGQTGEQRTQGGDELQELPQAQGSHAVWKPKPCRHC